MFDLEHIDAPDIFGDLGRDAMKVVGLLALLLAAFGGLLARHRDERRARRRGRDSAGSPRGHAADQQPDRLPLADPRRHLQGRARLPREHGPEIGRSLVLSRHSQAGSGTSSR